MGIKTQDSVTGDASKQRDRDFLSKIISQYIRGEDGDEPTTTSRARPSNSQQHFKRQDVIKALNNIQLTYRPKYVAGQQVNINTDDFKTALLNSMAKLENTAIPKTMNQIDGRTVDFVEMIFGAFLRDDSISNAVKNLLLRLQIPVIKTSLLDSNFFYNNNHPARHLLNTIAKLCIGIEDEEHTVYKTIDLILEQLLRSYDENPVSFKTALSSLQRLKTIELEKQTQNEQQIRKQIMQEHARQTVLTELQFHTMHTKLPKAVQPLILNHWSTLMFQRYVKFGKESDQWREAVSILKLMCDILKPIESAEQWSYVNSVYIASADKIKSMLEATSQSKEKIFLAINNLTKHCEHHLQESAFYQEQASESNIIDSVDELELQDEQLVSASDEKENAFREQVAMLPKEVQPNAWFEVYIGPDKPIRRLKLSIILNEQAQLIFVDHRGNKILEKSAEDFKNELASELSKLIADRLIFEHALSQVITSISSSR
jgi:hypothetical protein